MRNLILMAIDKASRLDDDQLAEQIAEFESGKRRLRLPDEQVALSSHILNQPAVQRPSSDPILSGAGQTGW
jgi:hypothetical protein